MTPTVLSAQRCKTISTVATERAWLEQPHPKVSSKKKKKKHKVIKNTHTQARKHLIIDLRKGN